MAAPTVPWCSSSPYACTCSALCPECFSSPFAAWTLLFNPQDLAQGTGSRDCKEIPRPRPCHTWGASLPRWAGPGAETGPARPSPKPVSDTQSVPSTHRLNGCRRNGPQLGGGESRWEGKVCVPSPECVWRSRLRLGEGRARDGSWGRMSPKRGQWARSQGGNTGQCETRLPRKQTSTVFS